MALKPSTNPPRPAVGLGDAGAEQDITVLRKRYEKLSHDKTAAETKLAAAREKLDELKRMAREQYGTDDPDALKAKLAQMKQENEQKRAAYQQALDQIETNLRTIDAKYQQSLQGNSGSEQ